MLLAGGCAQGRCDFHSHGGCIEFTYDVSGIPDLQARVDKLLDLEMAFWDLHSLDGWKVQFRATQSYDCYLVMQNDGCTNYFLREMSVYVAVDADGCFESAELLHELGHFKLGDPTHSDAKWHDIDPQFAPIVWDRPDAADSCQLRYRGIFAGMWPVRFGGF
jgi:hypothetical protein